MGPNAELLTSAEAAALLGVSPSSVKRWAEEGRLACVKTAGRHRRFERSVVERFRMAHAGGDDATARGPAHGWIEAILAAEDPQILEARLLDERARLGSWWQVAESLGPVIAELGRRWADGTLSVIEEHLASER
ncbi:MAG TPA: helix-turn-helix domain-containing protein, partial [Polyangia bacterium]